MKLVMQTDHGWIEQVFASPAVYLDHWAICDFSSDAAMSSCLVDALRRHRGTFVLSTANVLEFAKPSNPRHALEAEDMLEQLLPQLYLTDCDLEKAHAIEQAASEGGPRPHPSGDRPMMRWLAERAIRGNEPLTIRGYLTASHDGRDYLSPLINAMSKNIRETLLLHKADPTYGKRAGASVPDGKRPRTHVVLGELMRELTIDPVAAITDNDIVDWQHAAVPAMCCDFVMLDSKWAARVTAATERARAIDHDLGLAQAFSKRHNGMRQFLDALEAWKRAS